MGTPCRKCCRHVRSLCVLRVCARCPRCVGVHGRGARRAAEAGSGDPNRLQDCHELRQAGVCGRTARVLCCTVERRLPWSNSSTVPPRQWRSPVGPSMPCPTRPPRRPFARPAHSIGSEEKAHGTWHYRFCLRTKYPLVLPRLRFFRAFYWLVPAVAGAAFDPWRYRRPPRRAFDAFLVGSRW